MKNCKTLILTLISATALFMLFSCNGNNSKKDSPNTPIENKIKKFSIIAPIDSCTMADSLNALLIITQKKIL